MGIKVTLDQQALGRLWEAAKKAAVMTAEELHADLVSSKTMPYRGGDLSGKLTFTDSVEDGDTFTASVINDGPYARNLHFNPQFNFFKGKHPNAGGEWLEPYIDGEKKDFAEEKFAAFMKGEIEK